MLKGLSGLEELDGWVTFGHSRWPEPAPRCVALMYPGQLGIKGASQGRPMVDPTNRNRSQITKTSAAMPSIVEGSIKFLKWQELYERERPFQILMDIPPEVEDQRHTNLVFEEMPVQVTDMREFKDELMLDTNGFMVSRLPGFDHIPSPEVVEKEYIPAIKELVRKELPGADEIVVYNWRVRLDSTHEVGQGPSADRYVLGTGRRARCR
jgi:hypothetical protein